MSYDPSPAEGLMIERRGNSHWKGCQPSIVAVLVRAAYGSPMPLPLAYYERWGNNGKVIETKAEVIERPELLAPRER